MKHSIKTLQSWVDALDNNRIQELTEWEDNFLKNVKRSIVRGWPITERQEEILERIYAEKTA